MAFKKNDVDNSYRELKRELAAESIGRLYIFHGEETYLRDHCVKEMREKLLTGGLDEFNHHVLPAKDFTIQRLRELVDAMPMMSERTLVEVYDYDIYKGDKEALTELLSDLPDYVCLIFIYDVIPYKPDNRVKLAKLIKETGREVNFPRQGPDGLITWIQRRFKALGHEISAEDARYLVFLCGDLMNGLITEIGKIGAYAKAERVTRQDIDTVATPQLDAVVFQLTDAISMGNFDKAFSVMSDLLHMQETPIGLLAMLGWQLRRLYTARLAIENGKGAKWLMELWGISWASTAEKLLQSARRFSLAWCRRAVIRCEETDLAMKSTGADAGELLTGLLLELAEKKSA
ncbi:DNA polymerase III subunit delta [Vermiculatibacterium agrestimuris]|uniref:DNA polymerase III subunit delta n=1 Tax=Vermiculatibacterium agrestimuris TaxID=2941519 RepID=UPI002040B5D9|nr:DNA polymerase III subunit delta [Vermiculatibacterium agrestimuris]